MEISKQKITLFIIAVFVVGMLLGGMVCSKTQICKILFGTGESEEGIASFSVTTIDWKNPEEPTPSSPLEEKDVPNEAVRIGVTAEGFSPSSFEAEKGKKIFLALSGQDEWVHVLKFKEESLADIGIAVGSDEVRVITFYAPSEAGEYEFYCDVPGHELRGEKGVMIVK